VVSGDLWIGAILLTLIVLSTAANVAVREFSRVDMAERLEKLGRTDRLDYLTEHRNELMVTTSFVRMASILSLVLLIARWFGARPAQQPAFQYVGIFVIAMFLVMIFAVAIPQAWAKYSGSELLIAGLPALIALHLVLYPMAMFVRLFDGVVRRLAGVPDTPQQETQADQIEREILDVVSEGEKSGAVHEQDADMIESVIELRDTQVGGIMTPRTDIVALPETATLIEAKELIIREGHSRIPIYGESIDDIKGVLYAKDLLSFDENERFEPTEIMRKVPFVPETKLVPDLLHELREKQVHLAVVLDEYGGTAGLVTIEDIIEEIVGEIVDEYETPEPTSVRRIDPTTVEIDARVHIDELNDELHIELPEDDNYETVGGFLFSELGKIPAPGEEFRYHNVRFHVLDAEERKINRLRVEVLPEGAEA
jgi:putative hemolysin